MMREPAEQIIDKIPMRSVEKTINNLLDVLSRKTARKPSHWGVSVLLYTLKRYYNNDTKYHFLMS